MRKYKYKNTQTKELEQIVCNGCKKELSVKRGICEEGVFSVRHTWDYMSGKDGKVDSFDLCEECYERFIMQFQIPVLREDVTEFL